MSQGSVAPPIARAGSTGMPAVTSPAPPWGAAAALWLLASTLLVLLQLWLQNVNISTANGLWKSIIVRQWMTDPGWSRLDFANVLYFPTQALFCTALDRLRIFPNEAWRQIAVLNTIFGGLGLAAVFLFVATWLRRRAVAALTALLYGSSAFYLLLSVISEDIMPGACLVLIATLLACAWFSRPSPSRIAAVAVLFSIGWLWEWRLIFPSLPAMLLALFLARGAWPQRIARPVLFLLAMAAAPLVLTIGFMISSGAEPAASGQFLFRLFWAGKGVGSGWGGFSNAKAILAVEGMAQSLLGGRNMQWPLLDPEVLTGALLLLVLVITALRHAWRRRCDPDVTAAFIVLGGTFVAGTIFNLYVQPSDPQMVVNVMFWTVPAWALLAQAVAGLGTPRGHHWHRPARVARPVLLAACLAPLAWNVHALAATRGADTRFIGMVSRLDAQFDPRRTVFLYFGFENEMTWQFASGDGTWDDPAGLALPPAGSPRFKFISATQIAVDHPTWTAQQQSHELTRRIDAALDRGYRVVAGPAYRWPDAAWIDAFATISGPALPKTIRATLAAEYRMRPVYDDPVGGIYSSVTRRSAP